MYVAQNIYTHYTIRSSSLYDRLQPERVSMNRYLQPFRRRKRLFLGLVLEHEIMRIQPQTATGSISLVIYQQHGPGSGGCNNTFSRSLVGLQLLSPALSVMTYVMLSGGIRQFQLRRGRTLGNVFLFSAVLARHIGFRFALCSKTHRDRTQCMIKQNAMPLGNGVQDWRSHAGGERVGHAGERQCWTPIAAGNCIAWVVSEVL
eukprot:TRINITY_DN8182_c0_g1_i2.p1 TRINITY_DN8182_c0_g1~~TRINITY_DN8182_c0_g1_i2.p1  ORF type:complete len:203 (+),score=0.18 TRINITY_DN8182_c0_g1_i2:73-681(+)